MAEEGWRPPVPLSAIPGQLLDIVANHLESHCYHRHGEDKAPGLNRMRQHTHWGRGWGWEGTNFRISHAEGDVWGPGEEMPAGLPSAWSNSEGFIFGKTGPVISRNLEGEVAGLLVRLGVRTAE